ncbi:MAG: SDR family oxidoreductase [Pseudomonadota bacterium]
MASHAHRRKTAMVTGGARGIGRAIVENLAQDHDVALCYNTSNADWAMDRVFALQGNLSEPDTAKILVSRTVEHFGRLDIVINNAGIVASSSLEEFDAAAYRAVFDVNTLAPHAILSAALPHLSAGAAIVNVSSVNAQLPPRGASLYGASKAALELWTKGAAKELGPRGIRVNAVSPGAIDIADASRPDDLKQAFVDMTALGRMGTPEDIAAAVRFLVGEDAAFITGEVLVVSGGYRL